MAAKGTKDAAMRYVRLNPQGRGKVHRGVLVTLEDGRAVWRAACMQHKPAWAYRHGVPRSAIEGEGCLNCGAAVDP